MKVLVLGSGAKDHAIAWWFSRSRLIEGLYMAPSNPGTSSFAVNLPDVNPSDKDQVLAACREHGTAVIMGSDAHIDLDVGNHAHSMEILARAEK